MNLLDQFKRFLENQISNPEIEAEDRVPFKRILSVKEDGIDLVAETELGSFTYDYNCYQDLGDTQLFDFELV
ncbi:hypothetical protein [Enterococcus olivae]